jgi:RNA polymerase sigma-70 factor (ECF subfamily)
MSLQNLADQELISLYLSGNEGAFAHLLKRHQDRLFRYINSKVRDADLANDIFQDAFMKVIMTMKSGNYNEEGKFLPWLMRISHNLIIDHFRKTNKVRFLSESRTLNEEFTIFHKLSTDEKNSALVTSTLKHVSYCTSLNTGKRALSFSTARVFGLFRR